jgi:GT2 family glycosyltransferase
VIDDGSTDGTAEAIQTSFPQVEILTGDGNLWWTGAIEMGMRYAYEKNATHIFWLNDDTLPESGTLTQLLTFCQTHPNAIAASQCSFNGEFTYGGRTRTRLFQHPIYAEPGTVVNCDALDGNAVCIPRSVIDSIGYPMGKKVPHYGGDNLYTWKAKQAGYQLCLLGDAKSICPMDHPEISWTLDPEPIWKYWRAIASPKTSYYLPGYWYFCTCYWGGWGLLTFIRLYLKLLIFTIFRLLIPRQWLVFLRQRFRNIHSV